MKKITDDFFIIRENIQGDDTQNKTFDQTQTIFILTKLELYLDK